MPTILAILNVILPGSGLLLRDHLAAGLLLLLGTLITIGLLTFTALLTEGTLAQQLLTGAGGLYGFLAVCSLLAWYLTERRRPWDRDQVIGIHQAFAKALLAGQDSEALTHAHSLVKAAPDLPGSWRALALIARRTGKTHLQHRAMRQESRLSEREQLGGET